MAFLSSSHPYFSPSNVYVETEARYQTKPELIFKRLAARRALSPIDEALRPMLGSEIGRQLYFVYGPYVLTQCTFCDYEEPFTYLVYGLPSILGPHFLNSVVLGIVTSRLSGGMQTARWRTMAIIAGIALAAGELWMTYSYELSQNGRATRAGEIDFFYWRKKTMRIIAIA